jgi:hypothetical protein
MYYYDVNAKITLIERLITEFRGSNILVMDFDTQLSSLVNNQILCSNCGPHPNLEIFLPYQITRDAMVNKVIEYDKCNSLIIIDSLNGLLDYFNSYGNKEISKNNKYVENFKHTRLKRMNANHAGYKSLNLIKIIFDHHANKEIPVIITSYHSQSSIDRLMFETISEEAIPHQEHNHFRRISNLVSLLEYFHDKGDLFMTILKNNHSPTSKTLSDFSHVPHYHVPHTRKITKNLL